MFWCYDCYALNDHPAGPCSTCGKPVEMPAGLSYAEHLVWTLGHPDGDRALLAAKTLGQLQAPESIPALRRTVEAGPDVYIRAEALRSLIAIMGVAGLRPWLDELAVNAPLTVRASPAKL